jgi:penicillin-binding protein 2
VFKRRLALVSALGGLYFLLLLARLFQLQIAEADRWRLEAERLSRRQIRLPAHRGAILDRHGEVLATDRLELDLTLRPSAFDGHPWRCEECGRPALTSRPRPLFACPECGGREFAAGEARDLSALSGLLGISPDDLERRMADVYEELDRKVLAEYRRRRRDYDRARKSDVARELSRWRYLLFPDAPAEAVRQVALHPRRFRGLTVRSTFRRVRPAGDAVRLLVGRLSGVYEDEAKRYLERGLSWGEIFRIEIGRSGLERALEDRLAARDGRRIVSRDARGRPQEVLDEVPARDGEEVRTSLDLGLQNAVTKALGEACRDFRAEGGAFVAMEPETGEVLVLATWPPAPKDGLHLALGPVVPGSVYKVATALAGLMSEELDPDELFDCTGDWNGIGCHGDVHGEIDLEDALAHSCNGYFAHAAETMGIELLSYWSRELGFGSATGTGLEEELQGLVPDESWKAKRHRDEPRRFRYPVLHPGEVRQIGFGQGYLLVTPIQMARLMAVVANGGHRVAPTLVLGEGRRGERFLEEKALERVRKGLEDVVDRGTAARSGLGRFRAAGKTGTAELAGSDRNMAWFAGYAPAEAPRVAFACYLRRTTESGAVAAGPVVVRFLEEHAKK